jgi:hypothetical protein
MSSKRIIRNRIAAAGLLASALAMAGVAAPAQATSGWYITGTGGAGVNARTSPWTTSAIRYKLNEGQHIDIRCQYEGQVIGGSRIWDRLRDGAWVTDYYVSTAVYNGYDSRLEKCNDVAVNWARGQVGSTAHEGMCDRMVAQAYGFGGSGYYTARDHWNHLAQLGLTRTGSTNLPVGALVFFERAPVNGQAGHVAIHVGGGSIVSNGIGGKVGYTTVGALAQSAPYLGWSLGHFPNGWGTSW